MINVKAYTIRDRVFVQYYDTGNKHELRCPDCTWTGNTSDEIQKSAEKLNFSCPCCANQLGMLSPSLSEQIAESYEEVSFF